MRTVSSALGARKPLRQIAGDVLHLAVSLRETKRSSGDVSRHFCIGWACWLQGRCPETCSVKLVTLNRWQLAFSTFSSYKISKTRFRLGKDWSSKEIQYERIAQVRIRIDCLKTIWPYFFAGEMLFWFLSSTSALRTSLILCSFGRAIFANRNHVSVIFHNKN